MEQTYAQPWRLIRHAPARGDWNMAVDEAILDMSAAGKAPPTLRLYAWSPACLSLGHAQSAQDVDRTRLEMNGWMLVRRQTGGRAILHIDELTYAVIAPLKNPIVAGSVLESYSRLAKALLRALNLLALNAHAAQSYPLPAGADPKGPVCFEVPSNYEITLGGKKLIGSAQARRREGVLQHGTLPLYGDLARITSVLAFPEESSRKQAATRLLEHATTLQESLGRIVPWSEAAEAFVRAFQEEFNLQLVPGDLTQEEEARLEELLDQKYSHPDWTLRI
jgi:lipoyl(octanoyl) transferase